MPKPRVLIAGGGIAGLACALALGREGREVSLVEQAAVFSEVGAGIQLGPNVTRRLAALGLQPLLDAVAARPRALVVRDADTDGLLARMPLGPDFEQRYRSPYLCVHRADLHRVLLDAVRAQGQAELHLNARLDRIEAASSEVHASSTDGRRWESPLLVGADGLWSEVRRQVVPQDTPPRATGHTAWRALARQADLSESQRSEDVTVWLGARLHVVAYPLRRGEALNVVVLAEAAPAGDARDWSQASGQEALRSATGRVHARLQSLFDAMPGWKAWTLNDRAPLRGPDELARGRIALVGDAAHPMLPYLAQGAGMAIEDACALAEALRAAGTADPQPALQSYAQARWRRNAQVQARARRNARIFHAQGPLRWARDASLRLLGARLLDVPWLYEN